MKTPQLMEKFRTNFWLLNENTSWNLATFNWFWDHIGLKNSNFWLLTIHQSFFMQFQNWRECRKIGSLVIEWCKNGSTFYCYASSLRLSFYLVSQTFFHFSHFLIRWNTKLMELNICKFGCLIVRNKLDFVVKLNKTMGNLNIFRFFSNRN